MTSSDVTSSTGAMTSIVVRGYASVVLSRRSEHQHVNIVMSNSVPQNTNHTPDLTVVVVLVAQL